MERAAVQSSNIASIGYDANFSILEIEFKGGEVYQYTGVPPHHHAGIMAADSHGKYLNTNIKGKYPFRQLR